jgi:hypothetical protein
LALCLTVASGGCKVPAPSAPVETAPPGPTSAAKEGEVSFEVRGVVLDRAGAPVAGAMVMQGGRSDERVLSDGAGKFKLTLRDNGINVPAVVAAMMGYRAVGVELLMPPEDPVELRLHKVEGPDNIHYVYEDPGDGENIDLEDCTHCHQSYVQQFLTSKHAQATRNPLVQDLYAGVNRALSARVVCEEAGGRWLQGLEPGSKDQKIEKCYLGDGVLAALNTQCGGARQPPCDAPALEASQEPKHFGACADCHAPGIDGVAGGRGLHEATGTAYEKGVHCDVCHKVADIDLGKPPGVGQRLVMGRPGEPGENTFKWEPVFYGPIIDVPNPMMRASYQPKFNESQFCAGCHEQNQPALLPGQELDAARWPDGLPVHSTFSEWQAGSYGKDGVPCQHCHMPVSPDALNSISLMKDKRDESITFGWERPGEDNRMHTFMGPLDGEPRLIDTALRLSLTSGATPGRVATRVTLKNAGAGHAVPTGEPMRSLVLVVEATSNSCGTLEPVAGMSIDDVGGALASGVVGQGVTVKGRAVKWADGAKLAQPGQRLRVVRPTGEFLDYDGVGWFAGAARQASEKGLPAQVPVAHAEVVSVQARGLTLKDSISVEPGDLVYLGDSWSSSLEDGAPSRHLAGAAGMTFARVLVDAAGARQAPHYRAIDMVRDNRIAPGASTTTEHAFARGESCAQGKVRATLLYRPHPLALAQAYGWDARDYIIATAEVAW